jgi:hypothetical protein
VSYTYRTDKLLDAINNAQGFVNQRNCPRQWVGFAIELETELQEATFEIERLCKANLQLREGAEQQKQRIKRLEEALEAVANVIGPIGKSTWVSDDELNQAWELYMKTKEAKP